MALPVQLTNIGAPVVDATQLMQNFNYLDTGKVRDAVQAAVAADGSATATITYATPFATATTSFRGIVFVNYTGTDFAGLDYQITNVTKTGFTIRVGGGQAGTTVDVHYSVLGN